MQQSQEKPPTGPPSKKRDTERLAPRIPSVTAAAAAARGPGHKKLKWRTRDTQNSRLYNLQLDLNDLQQQIKSLQDYKEILYTQTQTRQDSVDDCYLNLVMQYHRVFQHGYGQLSEYMTESDLRAADAAEFVYQMMDENVTLGKFLGPSVLLDQWERCTLAFSGLQFRLVSSRVASCGETTLISATTNYSYEITERTFEFLFPNAPHDHPQIVNKLLGREFHGVVKHTFTFDPQSHRVVHYDSQMDFFETFADLLQDSTELCELFENATISDEFFIGDTSRYPVRGAAHDDFGDFDEEARL